TLAVAGLKLNPEKYELFKNSIKCLGHEETAQQQAFETLKTHLITAPILRYPNFERTFYLYTDTSGIELGAVLAQKDENKKEYAIAYASKSLTRPERNYAATELECYAVVWAVEYFHHYLGYKPFIVVTDHAALRWLHNTTLKGRRARWILRLQLYNFTIVHRSGRVHNNADALSRIVTDIPRQENGNRETVSHYQKVADMRNVKENHQGKLLSEETKFAEFEEVEVFRAIAQKYFPEEIDEETKTIPKDLNTEESKWEDYGTDENEIWECELDEELTTSEVERERYLQALLIELAIEAEIEITWFTQNGYQYEPVSHSNLETRGLEFENNNGEWNDIIYSGSNQIWNEIEDNNPLFGSMEASSNFKNSPKPLTNLLTGKSMIACKEWKRTIPF
ncbi:21995_t:CDS:2, partial [Dentiscutata erythropus]